MTMRKVALIAGLAGVAALTTACGVADALNEDSAAYDVTGQVAALQVTTDAGTIEVIGSDRRDIRVTELLSWRKSKPTTKHQVRGDTLELSFTCPTTWGFGSIGVNCDVAYRVEVPKATRVRLASDSGDMTLTGLSGDVEATSDSGVIKGDGLTGKRVVTKTDSGDMNLAFAGPPDVLTTDTDSGDTVVRVPEGPYRVKTTSDSGDENIKTAHDPAAQRSINLSTDSGRLELAPA
ncbi:DUF4097 family beta strand repeat-containing protein [Nonomuraea sp. NPDC004580]|uniref:DUF4097 family beta strand repeat-containing protein n=1 Tax=Nonomuraea sp. NPDC004580 TaxID=3154552 RepID=UPI0033AE9BE6